MNLPKKGDIKKPKQKQQENTIHNLEETETIDLLSFKNKKNVEEKTDKLEELGIKQQKNYQKVLFICSGLENTITNQQNITIIYQMVEEMLKDGWKISILTSTDAIKLAVPDECNVIQDKIEFRTILHLAKKENFDLIVPLIEDEEEQKINKKTSLYRISQNLIPHLSKKTKVLQECLLTSGRTMLSYKSIAKFAEFVIPRRFEKIDDFICTNINVVCIKDKFNQVILDIQESGTINGKQFIISPTKTLKSNVYKLLIDKVFHFGEHINIIGVPYTIKISILRDIKDRKDIEIGNLEEVKEDKFEYKMYFRDIKFGFSEEVLFAIQQKNINLGDALYRIYTEKVLADVEEKHRFAYTYNYQKTYKIGYFVDDEDFDKTCIKQFNKTKHDIIANYHLFDDLLKIDENDKKTEQDEKLFFANDDVNGNIVFQSKNEDFLYSKITNVNDQNKYLLCFFDDQTANNINQQIVFYKLCKNIAEELSLKTVLITNYTLPIAFIGGFNYTHICEKINEDVVKDLQNHYNTKYTFLTPNEKMSGLIEIIEANGVKVLGLNYDDKFIYQKDEKIYRKLGLSIHSLYRNNLEGGETIFKLLAIKDQHKNYFLNDFISTEFVGYIGKFCNFIPANIPNYYVEPKVRKVAIDTMDKIQSSGVMQISFTYKEGNIFLYDVSQLFDQNIFVMNNLPYSIMFKIITLAITGRNIDLISRKNPNGKYMKFFQRINFEMPWNNTATMEDVSKNRVLSKIEKFLKN